MTFAEDMATLRKCIGRLSELDQALFMAERDSIMEANASIKADYLVAVKADIRKEKAVIAGLDLSD